MTTSNEIVNLFNEIFSSNNGDFESTITHFKEMGYGINYHTFEEQPGRRFTTVFTKHCDLDKEENPISTGAIFDLNGKLRSYPGNKANDYTLTPTTSIALSGIDNFRTKYEPLFWAPEKNVCPKKRFGPHFGSNVLCRQCF